MNDDFEILHAKLDEVLRILDECGKLIIALRFAPETNAKLVYNAASDMFALRRNIYAVRPELTPPHLLVEDDRSGASPEASDESGQG
jgi:hypothetical protein